MPAKTLSGFILLGALILGGSVHKTHAIVKGGSYDGIICRNAFRLNFIPKDLRPIAPPANTIKLTGISTVGGKGLALLEITKPNPGKETLKPILEEGQSEAGVEVLTINAEEGWVRVKSGGKEMILTFKNDGKRDAPVAVFREPQVGPGSSPRIVISTRLASALGSAPSRASVIRGPPPRVAEIQAAHPQTLDESVLRVATMTELTADSVKRGQLPPLPPSDLTPNPAHVVDGIDLRRSATNMSRRAR